jgi:hypothetical protein
LREADVEKDLQPKIKKKNPQGGDGGFFFSYLYLVRFLCRKTKKFEVSVGCAM